MTVISVPFFILAAAACFAVRRTDDDRRIKQILLAASYIFYAYWDIRFFLLLIADEYISFRISRAIALKRLPAGRERTAGRNLLAAGIILNAAVLFFFKLFTPFTNLLSADGKFSSLRGSGIILPLGISFFTLQIIRYLSDVYRERYVYADSFADFSLYISFFPKMTAGPLVRTDDFFPQLKGIRERISRRSLNEGLWTVLLGVFKKIVIADRLSVCAEAVFQAPGAYSWLSVLIAGVTYSLQLYYDFSGYSDIAVGLSEMMGIKLRRNFNMPFLSRNPKDLWRRWHISLSEWFRNYVYIPLGGSRNGKARMVFAIMVSMFLSGLWHGTSTNYLCWGIVQGIVISVYALCSGKNGGRNGGRVRDTLCIICTDVFFVITTMLFGSRSAGSFLVMCRQLFTFRSGVTYVYSYSILFFVMTVLVNILYYHNIRIRVPDLSEKKNLFLYFCIVWFILVFGYFGSVEFVYAGF